VETWNNTSVNGLANATGNKHYTLAFIISNGSCTATWNGDTSLSSNLYVTDINNLRAQGGDVIISFGGASGTELGQACSSVSALQAAYQSVITKYSLKWMDLDIESGAESDTASVTRRNQALKNLQAANPGLKVSYTLAVDRTGLPSAQINLLNNAKSNGVSIAIVNIMAMDYGPCYTDMGQAAIDAAIATRSQLSSNGISAQVGVTPMIGVNDVTCENFTTANAQQLVTYANANSYIGLLAYWAVGADPGNAYLNIFKTFH
jgi:chitinase